MACQYFNAEMSKIMNNKIICQMSTIIKKIIFCCQILTYKRTNF